MCDSFLEFRGPYTIRYYIYRLVEEYFNNLCLVFNPWRSFLAKANTLIEDLSDELANALHQIPHLNYMFQHVSSNFTYSTDIIQSGSILVLHVDCILQVPVMVHLLLYSICM